MRALVSAGRSLFFSLSLSIFCIFCIHGQVFAVAGKHCRLFGLPFTEPFLLFYFILVLGWTLTARSYHPVKKISIWNATASNCSKTSMQCEFIWKLQLVGSNIFSMSSTQCSPTHNETRVISYRYEIKNNSFHPSYWYCCAVAICISLLADVSSDYWTRAGYRSQPNLLYEFLSIKSWPNRSFLFHQKSCDLFAIQLWKCHLHIN